MFNGCRLFRDDLKASAKDSKICAEVGKNAGIRVKKFCVRDYLGMELFMRTIRAPHSTDLQVLKLDTVDTPRVELIFK